MTLLATVTKYHLQIDEVSNVVYQELRLNLGKNYLVIYFRLILTTLEKLLFYIKLA